MEPARMKVCTITFIFLPFILLLLLSPSSICLADSLLSTFLAPSPFGDSVEFQTLVHARPNTLALGLCSNPPPGLDAVLMSDRVDPNSFFLLCNDGLIHVSTNAIVNETSTVDMSDRHATGISLQQIIPIESTDVAGAIVQATDADGTIVLGVTSVPNTFGLYDRLGLRPPKLIWSSETRSANTAVTFAHDDTAVCWLCLDTEASSYCGVILTRLNYFFPNQSVDTVLPLNISSLSRAYIASHPRLPLLYVYSDAQLTEYDIVTHIFRMLVNFPSSYANIPMNQLAFTDSDQIILAALDYSTAIIQTNTTFVFRIHRDTLAAESIVGSEECGGHINGVTNLLYAANQQKLFVVCHLDSLLVASFNNGGIADPSSVAVFHTVTTPALAVHDVILLPSETHFRLVIFNFGKMVVGQGARREPWSIVATSGMSLTSTVNQLKCALPNVVSAQSDELQRQVLLHSCGFQKVPAAAVNGVPYALNNICLSFDTLLHRPGTSEVYAHCAPTPTEDKSAPFVVSVHTDNSQPQTVFICPNEQHEPFNNPPTTMAAKVILARNNSLVITCPRSLWLLPLDGPIAGSARMLLNLSNSHIGPTPVNFVNGAQVTSNVVFVSVEYKGALVGQDAWTGIIVVSLDEPQQIQTWGTSAFDCVLNENNTAAFHDVHAVQDDGSMIWTLVRQDLNADGSPAANFSLFRTGASSWSLPKWQYDSLSQKLIIVYDDGRLRIVDAYAQQNYPAARVIHPPLDCFDPGTEDTANPLISYRNLLLFSCPLLVGADWALMGISSDVLRNASAPVVWTPFLRSSPTCPKIKGPTFITADGMQLFLQCDISLELTINFQCSPGQEWSLGQCRSCLPGTSKDVLKTASVNSISAIPQCLSCPVGSIAGSSASFTCSVCPVGTFHDVSLGEVCRPCAAGRYANSSGMTDCPICSSGTVQPSLGSSTCTACPLGSLADSNAVTCIPCARGWYTPTTGASAHCVNCEGSHQNGLNCSYGMASVQEGYFAYLVEDASSGMPIYRTIACAADFCPGSPLQLPTSDGSQSQNASLWSNCPASEDGGDVSTIQYCCWPRVNSATNLLCAQCSDGYVPWGSNCVKCEGPNILLIIGLLVFAVLVVAFLFSNTQALAGADKQFSPPSTPSTNDANTTGHVALLLYFVQISSVQLGRSFNWIQWLHLSNPSAQSSKDCIAPLDPYQQIAFNLAIPIILTAILFLLGCVHFLFDRCRRSSSNVSSDGSFNPMVDSEMYRVTMDSAGNGRRQPLMQHDDMYGVGGNDTMYPALARAEPQVTDLAGAQLSPMLQSLHGCYQRNAWYWNSLVLLRRMLFAVVAVFLSDNTVSRNAVFILLHFGSLLLHQLAVPYRSTALNRVEVVTYSILLIQAVLLLLQNSPPPYTTWFELCILLLVILPVLALLVWTMRTKLRGTATKNHRLSMYHRICSQFTPSPFSPGRYSATILAILLFCYTSVTSTVFTFLHCVELSDDVSLVFQAPTMQCGSDRYKRYQLWVLLLLCIYVIGFPLASLGLLAWKRRHSITTSER